MYVPFLLFLIIYITVKFMSSVPLRPCTDLSENMDLASKQLKIPDLASSFCISEFINFSEEFHAELCLQGTS